MTYRVLCHAFLVYLFHGVYGVSPIFQQLLFRFCGSSRRMDLLSLGARSRKTGLTPKENLKRDKYDMEDVDAFFEDDDKGVDAGSVKRNSINSQMLHRSISSGSSVLSETPKQRDSLNNVARKIDFTEAEAERFRLSVVSMSDRSGNKPNKLVPLRSPLHEATKGRSTGFDHHNYDEYETDNFDFNNEQEATLSPIPIPDIDSPPVGSPVTQKPARQSKTPATSNSRGTSKKAASLTKQMALGLKSINDNQKWINLGFSLSDIDSEPSAEIISPPPTAKKNAQRQVETIVRPSPLPSPPPDGLRRSKRTKIAPLAFWRNERIVYTRADELEEKDGKLADDIHNIPLREIKEVVHIPERGNAQSRSRRSLRPRNLRANKSRNNRRPTPAELSGRFAGSEWIKDKYLSLDVFETPDSNSRHDRRIAWAPDSVTYTDHLIESSDPDVAENFKVATLFNEDRDFIACAMLQLPVDGFKLLRSSAGSVYIFHVVEGDVEVTLNDLTFVVTRACSFEVPRGNIYGFKNVGTEAATLFFVQSQPHLGEAQSDTDDSE